MSSKYRRINRYRKILKNGRVFRSFLSVLLLMLSSTSPAATAPSETSHTAAYLSEITKENNVKFFTSIKNRKINKLRVNSSGGEVEAAIKLGRWIYHNNIDIEVIEYCLSSCANYLFTAAHHKMILPGAIVAWHGNYHHLKHTGLWKDDIPARMKRAGENHAQARARVLKQVNHLVKLEQSFFKEIGVDEKICWVGKIAPYNVRNYYFLSVSDMARFGIKYVAIQKDYEKTNVKKFTEHIVYLKLK